MKNQPANFTPGGVTYIEGYTAAGGKGGMSSAYDSKFDIAAVTADLELVKARLSQIFYNDILRVASQYETRSNVTAVEWDLRKSESLVMLGPALERIDNEVLKPIIERVWGIAHRAGILPPPPGEIQGKMMNIEFVSMLAQAQAATKAASIERIFSLSGNLAGVDPSAMDNIDVDYGLDKIAELLVNDPKLIRSPAALAQIRQQRQQQAQAAQQADIAQKLAMGAKTLSQADTGNGTNMLQQLSGAQL
jgi:head-to-tail connecting protein